MRNRVLLFLVVSVAFVVLLLTLSAFAQEDPLPGTPTAPGDTDKPRVFVTQSHSWEVGGGGGGTDGSWGSSGGGGARPQTAEIIKTFGERCPAVIVNNQVARADFVVELDHEGGKAWFQRRNKVAVFERASGDVVISHSTRSLGNSVQDACEAIAKHWAANSTRMRSAAERMPVRPGFITGPARLMREASRESSVMVSSTPDSADIEIDGAFVGTTPSRVEVSPGDHTITIAKKGYQRYERKLKVTGGQVNINAELEPAK